MEISSSHKELCDWDTQMVCASVKRKSECVCGVCVSLCVSVCQCVGKCVCVFVRV